MLRPCVCCAMAMRAVHTGAIAVVLRIAVEVRVIVSMTRYDSSMSHSKVVLEKA